MKGGAGASESGDPFACIACKKGNAPPANVIGPQRASESYGLASIGVGVAFTECFSPLAFGKLSRFLCYLPEIGAPTDVYQLEAARLESDDPRTDEIPRARVPITSDHFEGIDFIAVEREFENFIELRNRTRCGWCGWLHDLPGLE